MTARAIQRDYELMGAEGCYLLSLIKAAERILGRYIDAYEVYIRAHAAGAIDERCYIYDPPAVMTLMLGGRWKVEKKGADYIPAPGEITILRYEREERAPSGTKTYSHFVLAALNGLSVAHDPYGDSRTVREGTLVSKRILWQVDRV